MKDLVKLAIDELRFLGCDYGDIRLGTILQEGSVLKNEDGLAIEDSFTEGFGVRVLYRGSWGFASSNTISAEEIKRVVRSAYNIALESSKVSSDKIVLAPEDAYVDFWFTPILIDPFKISREHKISLLQEINKKLRVDTRIVEALSYLNFRKEHKFIGNTEGTLVEQIRYISAIYYHARSSGNGDSQIRSFPMSHGGQVATGGFEIVESVKPLENVDRIREEAISLLYAPECPQGIMDLILDPTQLALQIHESCGHPSELDRVLGKEESFAGSSFLTLDKYKKFRYGSEIVNLFADQGIAGGLGTYGYDDEGVRSRRFYVVKDGIFCGYQQDRENAQKIGERSHGNSRAETPWHCPIIRNTNISLLPGKAELKELFEATENGIYMENNKCWSIDQKRLNFQFGCEIGYIIRNGKKVGIVKNPAYWGITDEFWKSCDMIANENYWKLYGVPNCGKGEPLQSAGMSHGASPARFKSVHIGWKT
ncbi:MAG: TldD/PmbA family protein [Planctomycetota bacterium]